MSRRSQRLVMVSVLIALAMIACIKMTGAVQKNSIRYALSESELRLTTLSNGTEAEVPYDTSPEPGQPGHGDEIGGWKKSWSFAEWSEWIIPGPVLTIISVVFIAYLYGPIWAIGTAVILVGIDVFAFYYNV